MATSEHSVFVRALPTAVWEVYVDPARIPEWQTGSPVIEHVRGGAGEAGSTYVSRRGPGSAQTFVVEADPPHRLVTRTDAYRVLRFDVASTLVPHQDGTLLTLRVETRWPRGLGLAGRLVELVILNGSEARKELGLLKALIEGEGA